ncbi:hypothetical protein [uncultured Victivallis sp.]|uniref:hypothetical protein n=1 Tax=uncultured Victivallis sp. TaxID=354118 RepID=UPI0025E55341|nr:hypothetical protein [uncultured Victivallis sp.]
MRGQEFRKNAGDAPGRDGQGAACCRSGLGTGAGVETLFSEVERVFGTLDAAVYNPGWDPGHVPMEKPGNSRSLKSRFHNR